MTKRKLIALFALAFACFGAYGQPPLGEAPIAAISEDVNGIVLFSGSENIEIIEGQLNDTGEIHFTIKSVDENPLPAEWHESWQLTEANVYLEVYNAYDTYALIDFLRNLNWVHPKDVHLVIKEEDVVGHQLLKVFPEVGEQ